MKPALDAPFRVQAILFDMDGTLIDTKGPVERAWRGWAAHHGLDPDAILAVAHGRRTLETVRRFAPAGLDIEEEVRLLEQRYTNDTDGVFAVRGALDLLQALPRRRWAVVTSAPHAMAELRLRQAGLPLPDLLIGGDEVSHGKPDPEGYRKAALALGFDPRDTLVFEDAPPGLDAGHAAGAAVIALTTTLRPDELPGNLCLPDLTAVRVRVDGDGLEVVATTE
ncbi:HAD-IA family hydrolase [Azospirillum picis]|uniref:Sugar-phosphatase n=1 Tax=Azospirillum picis TaxID=488438 RepID=A0ABU0MMQ7_9PROT|nr:HAD-IA family hydrolase [Azospirillum picis]MBP2300781.1 sugar-phosphatase [Azospirillum picis]MDQ0534750.1 sugar-phosphatase [Azospirillum picis]